MARPYGPSYGRKWGDAIQQQAANLLVYLVAPSGEQLTLIFDQPIPL